MTIIMPVGINTGWGICGQYLTRELAKLGPTELVTVDFEAEDVADEQAFSALQALCIKRELPNKPDGLVVHSPVLHAIRGPDLKPWYGSVHSDKPKIGYTFFETTFLDPNNIKWAKAYYAIVVAGSKWCESVLNDYGLLNTQTIIQGVDTGLFHPDHQRSADTSGRFIIFSGGKLELRKGQDLVIKAFKVLHDKYPDVMLVNAWYNCWDRSLDTMKLSPYIHFEMPQGDYFKAVNHLLAINGINPERVITLGPKPYHQMANVYRGTDVGLFPNRCEGGTNLVMMEYMACGKPAIAAYNSGQRDVLTETNAILLKSLHPFTIKNQNQELLFQWQEPNFDELVSALEWAYWHRDDLKVIGRTAAEDMAKYTWRASATGFFELLQ